MLVIKILSFFAFIASTIWCISSPGYEPAIAIATSLIALITSLRAGQERRPTDQEQVVGENGFGIQAGGDVKTGDIKQGGRDAR